MPVCCGKMIWKYEEKPHQWTYNKQNLKGKYYYNYCCININSNISCSHLEVGELIIVNKFCDANFPKNCVNVGNTDNLTVWYGMVWYGNVLMTEHIKLKQNSVFLCLWHSSDTITYTVRVVTSEFNRKNSRWRVHSVGAKQAIFKRLQIARGALLRKYEQSVGFNWCTIIGQIERPEIIIMLN